MSEPRDDTPEMATWHYQAWCGMCLAVVFVAQLTQGIFLTNVLTFLLGLLGLVSKLRWGGMFLLLAVAFAQSVHFYFTERLTRGLTAFSRNLELHDFLLTLGVLGYMAGHHRLLGIWHHLWPLDPRERRGKPQPTFLWMRKRSPIVQHRRREKHLRGAELVTLVFILPMLTLAAIGLHSMSRYGRGWLGAPLGLGPFLVLFWILLVLSFVVRQVFELWSVGTFSPMTARLYVQDQLWQQVRGEQRRIARWRAWQKVEQRARQTPEEK